MKKFAMVFPGQGSQAVGMLADLANEYPVVTETFKQASEALGYDLWNLVQQGPAEELNKTWQTQPALLAASVAIFRVWQEKYPQLQPSVMAGHSLGEYCAMYTSGVMSLENTLKAIQKRADLMSATKGGSMAAVLNASEEQLKAGLEEGSKVGYVDVANYNSPAQVVITGDEAAVAKAGELLMEAGARRVVPLAVSGAFHSKFLENAGKEFASFVADLDISSASIPVVTNVDAAATIAADDFKNKMPRQIYSSVHWTQTIENMIKNGVDTFVEIGPGKVLAGLNRKINSDVKTFNVYDKESLEATVNALKEEMAAV